MRKHWAVLLFVVVFLIVPLAAFGQTVRGDNVVVMKDPVTTALAGGASYVTQGNRQIASIEDPKHPLNGASGDCDGACVIGADKKSVCMGSCTWVDRGGDIAFFTWDGADQGGWKLLGGSGKYKDATGEGTWKSGPMSAGGFGHNIWQGTMQMTKK
jgi:hypothetical protein